MFNEQQPPGGGGDPPQQPPNNPNILQTQAPFRANQLTPEMLERLNQLMNNVPQEQLIQMLQGQHSHNLQAFQNNVSMLQRQQQQELQRRQEQQLEIQRRQEQHLEIQRRQEQLEFQRRQEQEHINSLQLYQIAAAQILQAAQVAQAAQAVQVPLFQIGSPHQAAHSPAQQRLLPSHSPALTQFARSSDAASHVEQFIAQEEANVVPRTAQQQALSPRISTTHQPAIPPIVQQPIVHHPQSSQQQIHIPQFQQGIQSPSLVCQAPQPLLVNVQSPQIAVPASMPPTALPAVSQAVPDSSPQLLQQPPASQSNRKPNRQGRRKKSEGPPRVDEALAYLRIIKSTFSADVPVYHRFLEIMKDFRAQRIETPDVIEQVAELLYDSPQLVLGFNTFLPTGYKITITEELKYVFTSPLNQPRILLSPEERRLRTVENSVASSSQRDNPNVDAPNEEDGDQDTNGEQEGEISDMEDEKPDEDEEMEEVEHLVEEVIYDDKKREECEDAQEELSGEMSSALAAHTLNIIELLKKSFLARPEKIVEFVTFIDFYLIHHQYFKDTHKLTSDYYEDSEKKDVTEEKYEEMPSIREVNPDDEIMDVEENSQQKYIEEERPENKKDDRLSENISIKQHLEKSSAEHLVSMLAECCIGEPDLLSATIDFLPYLGKLLTNGSGAIAEKIKIIFQFSATNHRDDIPMETRVNPIDVDMDLVKQMEKCKMGAKRNEKLRIKRLGHGDEKEASDNLMIFNKSYRILYERLKARTTPNQLSHLMTLLNMFMNMDISKEQLVCELPKIMGIDGSDAELIIVKLLGVDKERKNRPEHDKDAVMRKDLPAVQPKRGLRDQKMIQQAKNVEAATVCTLGPSYRFMKDSKATECSGRVELDSDLKSVLNDTWTSYPSWSSEDTGSQAIKKSNLEEFHCKTEDERYELDIIVDSNRTVIEELSKVLRDYQAMSDEEKKGFKLNDVLNCPSRSTTLRVLTKVFTNTAHEIIEAARSQVPGGIIRILDGLKEKDIAWSKFQQETNRTWRDALDKQIAGSMTLINNQQKNYDQKAFKSKTLVSAIEQSYEDKRKNSCNDNRSDFVLEYTPEQKIYRDVNEVTSYFFHELPGGKSEKDRSKIMLFRILMEWLCQPEQDVQVDLDNGEVFKFQGDINEDENMLTLLNLDGRRVRCDRVVPIPPSSESGVTSLAETDVTPVEKFRQSLHKRERRIFFGDDNVYMIIRYHQMIQDRFSKILAVQAIYSQEHFESQKKHKRWEEGMGSETHGRKALDENMRLRKEAVVEIRNVRVCPTTSYEMFLRELKQLGNGLIDIVSFEDSVKTLFPGDVGYFNNIDKLLSSLAKNIHHATCADERENPIKLYLKFRNRMINAKSDQEMESIVQEYQQTAEETLRGKNLYRFEVVNEKNAPFVNIWLIPREEKDDDDEEDDDGNDGGKEDDNERDDDGGDGNGGDYPEEQQPPPSVDDGDDEEDDDEEDDSPSGAECSEPPAKIENAVISNVAKQIGPDKNQIFLEMYKNLNCSSMENGEMHRIYMRRSGERKTWMSPIEFLKMEYIRRRNSSRRGVDKVGQRCDYNRVTKVRCSRIKKIR